MESKNKIKNIINEVEKAADCKSSFVNVYMYAKEQKENTSIEKRVDFYIRSIVEIIAIAKYFEIDKDKIISYFNGDYTKELYAFSELEYACLVPEVIYQNITDENKLIEVVKEMCFSAAKSKSAYGIETNEELMDFVYKYIVDKQSNEVINDIISNKIRNYEKSNKPILLYTEHDLSIEANKISIIDAHKNKEINNSLMFWRNHTQANVGELSYSIFMYGLNNIKKLNIGTEFIEMVYYEITNDERFDKSKHILIYETDKLKITPIKYKESAIYKSFKKGSIIPPIVCNKYELISEAIAFKCKQEK